MAIDPLKLTNDIRNSYLRYLISSFRLKDHTLRELFYKEAQKFHYLNGPILEATPPFKKGCYLQDLVKEGILEATLEEFIYDALPYLRNNPLYAHQEKAIRKITSRRNVVIASGTSSGKTECFLLPIYNHLLKEHKEGKLTPGVRALLVYPMNALANDQLRKLRSIARKIEDKSGEVPITFGRYVGDTKETRKWGEEQFRRNNPGEEPPKGELLSREEMRANPPHILITNYAMLEYLLLRPYDSAFFDGEHAKYWKFLILDEAHIYNGANGIEMGMLIRRLKDRVCEGKEGVLTCIATSATLMKGEAEFGKIAEFASNLFGEKFEWGGKEDNRDIVEGERIKVQEDGESYDISLQFYADIDKLITINMEESLLLEELYKVCKDRGVPYRILDHAKQQSNGNAKKFLYETLSKEENIIKLRNILETGAINFEDCVRKLAKSEEPSEEEFASIISLVNVAIWARPDDESLPLLPARYHLFVRAPEGIFISFFPTPKIFLDRREQNNEGHAVFELASCRRCGQEYLVGEIVNGKLKHSVAQVDTKRKNRYFLLWKSNLRIEEDEDEEVAVPEELTKKGKLWRLCVKCGAIWEDDEIPSCNCNDKEEKTLYLVEIIPKADILNTCYFCGLRSVNIVREFIFQQDAPTAVLATTLFQHLKMKDQGEKKILIFSDSRQDAAFFAPYLETTYRRILYRRLIVEAMKKRELGSSYSLEKLYNDLADLVKRRNLLAPGTDERKELWGWILQEFCSLDRRNCLEGVGLFSYLPIPPEGWRPLEDLMRPPWNLAEEEAIALYLILLNTLRFNKAITFPTGGPSPDDEIFARFHRNREYKFRCEKSDVRRGIYSWIPSKGRDNGRLDILQKLYRQITGKEANSSECINMLQKIWDDLNKNWVDKGLFQYQDLKGKEGLLTQLDYKYWHIIPENFDSPWSICDRCGVIVPLNVQNVCPTFNCDGKLRRIDPSRDKDDLNNNHYRFLYTSLSPENISVHEHTAQLDTDYASNIQQKFIKGKINILSCSTTFELGVDLGELETIFLRNVPPEPSNYIQRSGRAGRRLSSVGFTLSFCQLRSHDLTYFRDPLKMVNGHIKPPIVEICNEKIVRRHLHSMVLSRFFRIYRDYFGVVESFFKLEKEDENGVKKLIEYIQSKPPSILQSLKRTLPANMHSGFDLENWGWESGFTKKDGSLEIANAKIRDEFSHLKEFYNKKGEELKKIIDEGGNKTKEIKLTQDRNWAKDRMETIKNRKLLDFLATNTVIPKYGFPVDVVELTPLAKTKEAKNIQLERDLRIAISEFAPGSQVVANGYIWESAGLKLVRDRNWPIYVYAVCPDCRRFHLQGGTTEETTTDILCKNCNKIIERNSTNKFITPIFGFVTNKDQDPQVPGESRPRREFTTRPYFFDYKEPVEMEIDVDKLKIKCRYSTQGELAVICKGRKGMGFWICLSCGAAFSDRPKEGHKSPFGEECYSSVKRFHFGHTFKTDVLSISIMKYNPVQSNKMDNDFWYSLLYALLEGTSQALGIRRQDLDGCLYPYDGKIALVLFDTVPGGAGHVKRLIEGQNLREVLKEALERVKKCSCGEETSCYGCLRNYQNQFCHEQLRRGVIKEFLSGQGLT